MSPDLSIASEHSRIQNDCKYHPFKEESQILSFCEITEIKIKKQSIIKNLEAGGSIQVIFGAQGIGKTMLARHLSLSRRLNVQIIQANNGLNVVNIMKRLSTTINCPLISLTKPPMQHINNFVDHFVQQERPLCIMIDNAHLLPIQTLAAIIHCNNKILQAKRDDFSMALIGSAAIKDKIAPLISEEDKVDIKMFELENLSEESIIHYIYTKLRHAGWQGPLPIIPSQELKKIRSKSSGIPKNINYIISQQYFDNWLNNYQLSKSKNVFDNNQSKQIGLVSLATLMLIAALWAIKSNNVIIDNYIDISNIIVNKVAKFIS